jgi:SNF2 family DNA or RNA helicase
MNPRTHKYDIYFLLTSLSPLNSLSPAELQSKQIKFSEIDPADNCSWSFLVDNQEHYFYLDYQTMNDNYPSKTRAALTTEISNWRYIIQNASEYLHMAFTQIQKSINTDASSVSANSDDDREYKLSLQPNLALAKKLYGETMTLPVRFLQVIYMFLRLDLTNIAIPDSENELLSQNPPGFKLQLYDYQAKSLTWMSRIERGDVKINYFRDFYYGIEDPDTGEPFCYVSSRDVEETAKTLAHYHIYTDPPQLHKEFSVKGGLLADIMGNGKTVTGIAHIYSEYCRLGRQLPELTKGIEQDVYLPSSATLILCPNNIIEQWYGEFVKCLGPVVTNKATQPFSKSGIPGSFRVIKISTMYHLNALTHYDLMNADVVIVTYTMMTNTNHIGKGFTKDNGFSEQYASQRLAKMSIPELRSSSTIQQASTYEELERVLPRKLLYLYKWNRIIHDEFHEFINTKVRTNTLFFIIKSLLKAKFYWGFSGSSISDNENIMSNLPYLLHFEDDWGEPLAITGINKSIFFEKCVIKNTKRVLPPLKYLKKSVTPTDEERMLYKTKASYCEPQQAVRFACYHNLNIDLSHPVGLNIASVAQISNRLSSAEEVMAKQHEERSLRMEKLKCDLHVQQNFYLDPLFHTLKNLQALSDYPFTKNWINVSDLYFLTDSGHKAHNSTVKASMELDPNLRQARDFVREYRNVTKTISAIQKEIKDLEEANKLYTSFINDKTLFCCLCGHTSQCFEDFMVEECRDYFCHECAVLMSESGQKQCPKCRKTSFDSSKLAKLTTKDGFDSEIKSITGLSRRLWGSKICEIVDQVYSVTSFDPNRAGATKTDATNKVIIFAQWEDLLEQLEIALREVGIQAVTVKGSTNARTKAIKTFQEVSSCKVIILSSVFGASGINLVQANYVFIVHPFLDTNALKSSALDTNGINHKKGMAEQYEYQAICRAYRTGQTRPVTVMHFIREDTVEATLYNNRSYTDEKGTLYNNPSYTDEKGSHLLLSICDKLEVSKQLTNPVATVKKPLKPLKLLKVNLLKPASLVSLN